MKQSIDQCYVQIHPLRQQERISIKSACLWHVGQNTLLPFIRLPATNSGPEQKKPCR